MEKAKYEAFKKIKKKIEAGEPVTFAERNIYNVTLKNQSKKKKKTDGTISSRMH